MIKRLLIPFICLLTLISCGGNTEKNQTSDSTIAYSEKENTSDSTSASGESTETGTRTETGTPTVIDFWAEWCRPCQMMKPVFAKMETEYKDRISFKAVNIDENEAMANEYKVTAIPTFIFIDASGREISRLVGVVSEEEMRQNLEAINTQNK